MNRRRSAALRKVIGGLAVSFHICAAFSDSAGLTPEPAPAPRSSIDAPPDPVPLALS